MIRPVPASTLTWLFDFDPTSGAGVGASQYAFGVRTDDNSFWFHIGVGPKQWIKIGSGSGGGGGGNVFEVFQYQVTGLEPDLSQLAITLPVPILAPYVVAASCQGCANIVAVDVEAAIDTGFTLVGTGDFTAGDTISFLVTVIV